MCSADCLSLVYGIAAEKHIMVVTIYNHFLFINSHEVGHEAVSGGHEVTTLAYQVHATFPK